MKRTSKIAVGVLMCAAVVAAIAKPASAQVSVGIGIGPGYYGAPYAGGYTPYCDPRGPYYYPYYCNGYYGPAYYNGYYGYYRPTYYGYWPFLGFGGYYGGYYRGYYPGYY